MPRQNLPAPPDRGSASQKKILPKKGPPCYIPAPLRKLPWISLRKMGYCPLPLHSTQQELLEAFLSSPQFSGIDPLRLLAQRRSALRLILLSESDYYARQCALYLSALSRRDGAPMDDTGEKDHFWAQLDLDLPGSEQDEEEGRWQVVPDTPGQSEDREEWDLSDHAQALRSSLAVVSAAALDPGLDAKDAPTQAPRPSQPLSLSQLPSPAALVYAEEGPVLTPDVLDQLITFMADQNPTRPKDLVIALKPDQADQELMEELCFTYGFHVCRVGLPDQAYLRQILRLETDDLLMSLDPQADLDRIIAHTRQLRGDKFTELDLRCLVLWALQRQLTPPLSTDDLLYQPHRFRSSARKELSGMVALTPVKEALDRLLAVSVLEKRRLEEGKIVHPSCRNLAFSGPPGTGKSVTARLLARIMREEGCGTGRFVEAGREQLIGSYLGQTSPMVAKLFQQAKGGVLFIDEAGSLLFGERDQDIYAAEAVNALVRHMELSPETMVIFATYPQEMEELLSSNPGLSSRVAQVLDFPGYDDGQLWDILAVFAQKEGYTLPPEAEETCLNFFSALRRQKGPDFGNGREARRLFRAAVEELALRFREQPEGSADLLSADLERAARRLLAQPCKQPRRTIGF